MEDGPCNLSTGLCTCSCQRCLAAEYSLDVPLPTRRSSNRHTLCLYTMVSATEERLQEDQKDSRENHTAYASRHIERLRIVEPTKSRQSKNSTTLRTKSSPFSPIQRLTGPLVRKGDISHEQIARSVLSRAKRSESGSIVSLNEFGLVFGSDERECKCRTNIVAELSDSFRDVCWRHGCGCR